MLLLPITHFHLRHICFFAESRHYSAFFIFSFRFFFLSLSLSIFFIRHIYYAFHCFMFFHYAYAAYVLPFILRLRFFFRLQTCIDISMLHFRYYAELDIFRFIMPFFFAMLLCWFSAFSPPYWYFLPVITDAFIDFISSFRFALRFRLSYFDTFSFSSDFLDIFHAHDYLLFISLLFSSFSFRFTARIFNYFATPSFFRHWLLLMPSLFSLIAV